MRRPALLLSIAVLAGALLALRRRRRAPDPTIGMRAPAAPLAPAAAGTRFVSVPWELVSASAEDLSLAIAYRRDARMELDRIDAQETPTQVFVTVLMRWRGPAGGWFAYDEVHETAVPLGRPLGDRELVHAPVDEPGDRPLYP